MTTCPSKKVLSGAGRKRKGARRELQAVRRLEEQGYLVTKAGGSLGAFDLVAMGLWGDRFIQVKSNRKPGKKEMDGLFDIATNYFHAKRSVELWIYMDGNTEPEIYNIYPGRKIIKLGL